MVRDTHWLDLWCEGVYSCSHGAWRSFIVQLGFSAAFDRGSDSDLLFKLKSIGVGSSVLSGCREFLSNLKQRVVADGATGEFITIVPGVP